MQMPFGKFANREVKDVPKEYLTWLHGQGGLYGDLKAAVEEALGITPAPSSSMPGSDGSEAALQAEVARLQNQIRCLEAEIAMLQGKNADSGKEHGEEDVPGEATLLPPVDEEFVERIRLLNQA